MAHSPVTAPAGWKLDEDGWLWRKSRPSDPKIGRRSEIGCDDSTFPGRPTEGRVYVRSEADAEMIDRGKL